MRRQPKNQSSNRRGRRSVKRESQNLLSASFSPACEDARKVHPALIQYLGYGLHKITLRYKTMVNEDLGDLKIQGPHFPILQVIKESQKSNQAQIGDELGVDKATMVKMIDQLEDLGLIERISSTEDRRSKILQLTKKGQVISEKAIAVRAEVEKKFLNLLTPTEAEQFRRIVRKLLTSGS